MDRVVMSEFGVQMVIPFMSNIYTYAYTPEL